MWRAGCATWAFNPLHPSRRSGAPDLEEPACRDWEPIFLREQVFSTAKFPASRELTARDFRWQVAHAEPPGTSDTSQVATDHIDNAGAINSIAYLNFRPKHKELMATAACGGVPRVEGWRGLVGSSCLDDPMQAGHKRTACAAMRGYVNIGVCAEAWTSLHDPVYGVKKAQAPFDIKHARLISPACEESWTGTAGRLEGLEAFLRSWGRCISRMQRWERVPAEGRSGPGAGKIVFAENCARCHSSKQPPAGYKGSENQWFRDAVLREDFLQGNFLSDDEKYPVSEIGTNTERALATNAERGQIWEEFSSESYKVSPAVRVTSLADPLHPSRRLPPVKATGGRGYYRTPSLVSIWATAPFLHNNSVGLYNGDPSVAGRLAAYQSAMNMLLSPDQRPGLKSIRRTTERSRFELEDGTSLCVARNTPVDLITNIRVAPRDHFRRNKFFDNMLCPITGSGAVNPLFLLMDNAPDFVQDRGHSYGAGLPDSDKRALIEYMKLF